MNSDTSKLDRRKSTSDVTLAAVLGAPDPVDGGDVNAADLDLEAQARQL